ncbi:MAG: phage terminase small subunit P27 family [Betaproteobacteria bacterium]
MRGRKPKPSHLKVIAGNPGKRAVNEEEPKPQPVPPKCPSWLPPAGKRKWKELAPKLDKLGLLTEVDGEAFAMLCLHWANGIEAAKILRRDGLLVTRKRGGVVKNPANQILRENSAAFRAYAALFGLSPADRGRIHVPEGADDDDEFFGAAQTKR